MLLDRHPETNYTFTLKQGQVFGVLHELGDLARASHGDVPLCLPSIVFILQFPVIFPPSRM